jgi:hypothetical protein
MAVEGRGFASNVEERVTMMQREWMWEELRI